MNIKELRMTMMKSKKTDPEKSQVLMAILSASQMIAKNDGNRETTDKDIVSAAKKEIKMAQQSKDAGAPFNPITFEVCDSFLPKTMNESDTRTAIQTIVSALPDQNIKMMGKVMGQLKSNYGDSIDGGMASNIVKELLNT